MYDSVFFRGVQWIGEPLLRFLDFLNCNVDLFTDFKTEPPPKSLDPGLCMEQLQKYGLAKFITAYNKQSNPKKDL